MDNNNNSNQNYDYSQSDNSTQNNNSTQSGIESIIETIKFIFYVGVVLVGAFFLLSSYLGSDVVLNYRWTYNPLGMQVILVNNNSIPVYVKGTICYIDPFGAEYAKDDVSVRIPANSKQLYFSKMPEEMPLTAKFEDTYVLPSLS